MIPSAFKTYKTKVNKVINMNIPIAINIQNNRVIIAFSVLHSLTK